MSETRRHEERLTSAEWIVLLAGVLLFLGLTCYQLDLPGPHYDEAIEVLPAMQLLLGRPVEAFRGAGIRLGHTVLPLMVMDYIGAMNTYLVIPYFLMLGIDVAAMRLLPITYALITLLLTYALAREWWGRFAAAIAFLTLAASVSFVFWSRQGIFVTNLTATILMATLLSASRWWRTGRRRYLFLSAFLCGLGLYTKFLFLWAVLGMAGAFVLLNADRILKRVRGETVHWPARDRLPHRGEAAGALLAFCVPLLPMLFFNLQTRGTVGTLSRNAHTSYYGVNNMAFLPNLRERLLQFASVLRGDHLWYLGDVYADPLWLPAFLVVLGAVLAVMLWRRRAVPAGWRLALFPFVLIALIIVQSCVTISALWFTHFAILTPLPPLALAGGIAFLRRSMSGKAGRWLIGAAAGVLTLSLVVNAGLVDRRYHAALGRTGGYHAHSDASYRLADTLRQRTEGPVLAMDWGIWAQTEFLTRGEVVPEEVFGYESLEAPDASFADRMRPYLDDPSSLYVFHPREQEVYRGRAEAFNAEVARLGKEAVIEEVIYERSGRPAYILVAVR